MRQGGEAESDPAPRHGTILHFTCLAVATVKRAMPAFARRSVNWPSTAVFPHYVSTQLSRHDARRLCRHCRQKNGLPCERCKFRKVGALLRQFSPDRVGILPRVKATQSESVHQAI